MVIGNPKTEEFQIVRVNLLAGLLRTIASNMSMGMPIKARHSWDLAECRHLCLEGVRSERRGAQEPSQRRRLPEPSPSGGRHLQQVAEL